MEESPERANPVYRGETGRDSSTTLEEFL